MFFSPLKIPWTELRAQFSRVTSDLEFLSSSRSESKFQKDVAQAFGVCFSNQVFFQILQKWEPISDEILGFKVK